MTAIDTAAWRLEPTGIGRDRLFTTADRCCRPPDIANLPPLPSATEAEEAARRSRKADLESRMARGEDRAEKRREIERSQGVARRVAVATPEELTLWGDRAVFGMSLPEPLFRNVLTIAAGAGVTFDEAVERMLAGPAERLAERVLRKRTEAQPEAHADAA